MAASSPPVVPVGDPGLVDRIVAILLDGDLVVLPTDTVYGVAALARDRAATDRLFALKGRGQATPIAVLCTDAEQALGLAEPAAARHARRAAERFWPGPLTLVLPRRDDVGLHLGTPTTTVGVRVPAHDLVRAVAAAAGPLATTSANRHGEPTAATAAEAVEALGSGLDLVADGGRLTMVASTVIDATRAPWRVLREGTLPSTDVLDHGDGS